MFVLPLVHLVRAVNGNVNRGVLIEGGEGNPQGASQLLGVDRTRDPSDILQVSILEQGGN